MTSTLNDNSLLVIALREVHDIRDRDNDIATASLIEDWIDEAEGRVWFLAQPVEQSAGNARSTPAGSGKEPK